MKPLLFLLAALGPADVFVVANKKLAASLAVAEHYCVRRGVPKENVVALDLPEGEDISRVDYDLRLAAPLRAALAERRDKVKVLLTVHGVPLRVGRVEPSADDRAELEKLKPLLDLYQARAKKPNSEFQPLLRSLEERRRVASHAESEASVDSELALLWWPPYELRRWQMNPAYWQTPAKVRSEKPPIVMTARLDGPTPEEAKRLVDDALAAEAEGLKGKCYFDARGIKYDAAADTGHGYGGYDASLREAAVLLAGEAKLPVTLDDKPTLFASGSCTDCALYCGWYSLANYVDCCRFVKGAVAYHIASAEAVTLRDPATKQWCKNLLGAGACVTLGPVAEPYTVGFPKPAEFFGLLVSGKYPVVECYWRTSLFASWMTVLVGDPLYNPYGKTPKLAEDKVKPSPQGGRFEVR